jgi:hypothetical protein
LAERTEGVQVYLFLELSGLAGVEMYEVRSCPTKQHETGVSSLDAPRHDGLHDRGYRLRSGLSTGPHFISRRAKSAMAAQATTHDGLRVLITDSHAFGRTVVCAIDDDAIVIDSACRRPWLNQFACVSGLTHSAGAHEPR